jgi:DNA-binding Xre family transcriptional regulator
MPMSFRPLWITLAERGLKKGYLREEVGIAGSTVAKMSKDESVSMDVLERICDALNIPIEKVIKFEAKATPKK